MLNYAVTFFVIALVAAVLGFSGIAGSAAGIAQLLFLVFLVRLFSFGRFPSTFITLIPFACGTATG